MLQHYLGKALPVTTKKADFLSCLGRYGVDMVFHVSRSLKVTPRYLCWSTLRISVPSIVIDRFKGCMLVVRSTRIAVSVG